MPVLDVQKLPDHVIKQLSDSYDKISTKELMALAKLDIDPVREEIDNALSVSLGFARYEGIASITRPGAGADWENRVAEARSSQPFR